MRLLFARSPPQSSRPLRPQSAHVMPASSSRAHALTTLTVAAHAAALGSYPAVVVAVAAQVRILLPSDCPIVCVPSHSPPRAIATQTAKHPQGHIQSQSQRPQSTVRIPFPLVLGARAHVSPRPQLSHTQAPLDSFLSHTPSAPPAIPYTHTLSFPCPSSLRGPSTTLAAPVPSSSVYVPPANLFFSSSFPFSLFAAPRTIPLSFRALLLAHPRAPIRARTCVARRASRFLLFTASSRREVHRSYASTEHPVPPSLQKTSSPRPHLIHVPHLPCRVSLLSARLEPAPLSPTLSVYFWPCLRFTRLVRSSAN